MERAAGVSNWKLTIRRRETGVEILRAVTCDARAALPERLFGLPVTALGDHALAPGARAAEGEQVLVSCGAPDAAVWDNRRLESLALPPALKRIGDYALLNCAELKTLTLHDGVESWGGGALMNCRTLDTFRLTRIGAEQGPSLSYLADELSRELDVTILGPGGVEARLIFPEYREDYEENCPAHHFDYNIAGAGYPYHHCFRERRLILREYDGLWRSMLAEEHEAACALRLAWWRLRYPLDLGEEAAAGYLAYLRAHGERALVWRVAENDPEGLGFLLAQAQPGREALAAACAQARELRASACLALLMEEQHRRFPPGGERRFEL